MKKKVYFYFLTKITSTDTEKFNNYRNHYGSQIMFMNHIKCQIRPIINHIIYNLIIKITYNL